MSGIAKSKKKAEVLSENFKNFHFVFIYGNEIWEAIVATRKLALDVKKYRVFLIRVLKSFVSCSVYGNCNWGIMFDYLQRIIAYLKIGVCRSIHNFFFMFNVRRQDLGIELD